MHDYTAIVMIILSYKQHVYSYLVPQMAATSLLLDVQTMQFPIADIIGWSLKICNE